MGYLLIFLEYSWFKNIVLVSGKQQNDPVKFFHFIFHWIWFPVLYRKSLVLDSFMYEKVKPARPSVFSIQFSGGDLPGADAHRKSGTSQIPMHRSAPWLVHGLLQFSLVQLLSRVWLFVTPWIAAPQKYKSK